MEYRQNLSPIQLPWQTSISFKTRTANCTLLSVKMGNNDVYRLDIRDGTIVYLYDNSVLTSAGHVEINDGEWHSVQIKWMEDEVWLNIDYGQYEITKRSLVSIAGKIVTKVTVGDAKNLNKKSHHFFKIHYIVSPLCLSENLKNLTCAPLLFGTFHNPFLELDLHLTQQIY